MSLGSKETPIPVFAMPEPRPQNYKAGYFTGAPTSRHNTPEMTAVYHLSPATHESVTIITAGTRSHNTLLSVLHTIPTDINSDKL